MRTKAEIIEEHKTSSDNIGNELTDEGAGKAMDEWAKEFAKWLAENTQTVWEEKITLYRYTDKNNEVGNYTLDDIYLVFSEEN